MYITDYVAAKEICFPRHFAQLLKLCCGRESKFGISSRAMTGFAGCAIGLNMDYGRASAYKYLRGMNWLLQHRLIRRHEVLDWHNRRIELASKNITRGGPILWSAKDLYSTSCDLIGLITTGPGLKECLNMITKG
jgi:hypothetical protein